MWHISLKMLLVRFKNLYLSWVLFFLFIGVLLLFYFLYGNSFLESNALIALLVGVSAAFLLFVQIINANHQLRAILFQDFNKRYDKLNDRLNDIANKKVKCKKKKEKEKKEKRKNLDYRSDKDIIVDYINLCAEEYYWYKKGRISQEVWDNWNQGMFYFFRKQKINKILNKEYQNSKDQASYYGLFKWSELEALLGK